MRCISVNSIWPANFDMDCNRMQGKKTQPNRHSEIRSKTMFKPFSPMMTKTLWTCTHTQTHTRRNSTFRTLCYGNKCSLIYNLARCYALNLSSRSGQTNKPTQPPNTSTNTLIRHRVIVIHSASIINMYNVCVTSYVNYILCHILLSKCSLQSHNFFGAKNLHQTHFLFSKYVTTNKCEWKETKNWFVVIWLCHQLMIPSYRDHLAVSFFFKF